MAVEGLIWLGTRADRFDEMCRSPSACSDWAKAGRTGAWGIATGGWFAVRGLRDGAPRRRGTRQAAPWQGLKSATSKSAEELAAAGVEMVEVRESGGWR